MTVLAVLLAIVLTLLAIPITGVASGVIPGLWKDGERVAAVLAFLAAAFVNFLLFGTAARLVLIGA